MREQRKDERDIGDDLESATIRAYERSELPSFLYKEALHVARPVAWMIRNAKDMQCGLYASPIVAQADLAHHNRYSTKTAADPYRIVPLYEGAVANCCLTPSDCKYAPRGWCPKCEPVAASEER